MDLFRKASKDESLFPPKCCKFKISLHRVSERLTADEISRFQEAAMEFTSTNRLYCANKDCLRFIPRTEPYEAFAKCPYCQKLTCSKCKAAQHDGECPADENLKVVLDIAETFGWRRCSSCQRVVELVSGCYHIT